MRTYLAPIMEESLAQLEGFGELDQARPRLSEPVRAQLAAMSPATARVASGHEGCLDPEPAQVTFS